MVLFKRVIEYLQYEQAQKPFSLIKTDILKVLICFVKVPHMQLPPPYEATWHLQDGVFVTKSIYNTLKDMLRTMNSGISTLQDLTATIDAM